MQILKKINNIRPINEKFKKKFQENMDILIKPQNSLGKLESIGAQIAGIKENCNYNLKNRKHFVFSADNGVQEEGVSACPKEYTRLISETMLKGTAAISILCKIYNVDFALVDVGIDGEIRGKYKNFLNKKIANGTKNLRKERAMPLTDIYKAFMVSFKLVKKSRKKYSILSCGEMGIGNTTSSGALIHRILGENLDLVIGKGSGIEKDVLRHKKDVIEEACNRVKSNNIYEILSELGGYDIASMTGFYLACAYYRIPVILDGYISLAAALVAYKINPKVKDFMLASHQTAEIGGGLVCDYLKLKPFLNLELCLGEGSGALLAYPVLDSIIPIYTSMTSQKNFKN